ncbi:Transcription factor myb3r-5 [Recurvomyces mirabilis]|uniref:Transcription factor myb3r-5 n=1 Tax=Recurvomyces mirabilis TaxID=574656 RepID=A0AAE1C4F1_9PEZI|nr:Transcription factor myb3r-5 [Recurvomyces mirabilis]KAK5157551.1 myb-like DNA-binding protein bas1 [Recurvomyces mirabilis]
MLLSTLSSYAHACHSGIYHVSRNPLLPNAPFNAKPLIRYFRESKGFWENQFRKPWTEKDNERLIQLRRGGNSPSTIAPHFPGRTVVAIRSHWSILLKRDSELGRFRLGTPWTEEDRSMVLAMRKAGKSIVEIQPNFPGRSRASFWGLFSREATDPDSKKGKYQPKEDAELLELRREEGQKWAQIAKMLSRSTSSVVGRYQNLIQREAARLRSDSPALSNKVNAPHAPPERRPRWLLKDDERMIELGKNGLSSLHIGALLDHPRSASSVRLRRARLRQSPWLSRIDRQASRSS